LKPSPRPSPSKNFHRIKLDLDSTPVILGSPLHSLGLTLAQLKRVLKNRLAELKKDRERELLGGGSGNQSGWTDELSFNKQGKIEANLANLTLMLRCSPEWCGVLGYSEFSGNIIIRRSPPWGYEAPDTAWNKKHITQTRVWFTQKGGRLRIKGPHH
jgi:hypothetical protein